MVATNDMKSQALNDLLQEVYDAYMSGVPDLLIPQIAAWSRIPTDTLHDIGKTLVNNKLNIDVELEEFNQMVERYRQIEQIPDAGYRAWKLQALARKYKRPVSYLTEAYSKALVNQAPLKPLSVKEFRAQHEADAQWLVKGWISQGTTLLLHADGGVGKTLFCYELMESVLYGRPWNGYQVEQGNVLLVQTDEPTLVTNERIDIRGIEDDAPLAIQSDWQVEGIPRLESWIVQTKPKLVIVDSLTSINRSCVFSENDTEYARPLLELVRLGNTYGCTIIVIHHSNAGGNSRGTSAIHNSVSEVWGLSKGEKPSDRLLRVQKTRLGRPPGRYRFRFDDEDFTFAYLGEDLGSGEEADDSEATNEKRIALWLSDDERRGIPITAQEAAEVLGLNYDSTRRSLYEIWAKGIAKRYRPKSQKQYCYYVGELLSTVTTDRPISTDQSSDQLPIAGSIRISASTDQLITANTPNEGEKIPESGRSDDQFPTYPKVGDIVVAKATALWVRSSSDKLPWQAVRPSDKQAATIAIEHLSQSLFDELLQPSKVLEMSMSGERVKVRNQQTGRTSVFAVEDVCVLKQVGRG